MDNILFIVLGVIAGLVIGWYIGTNEIYYRDHIQAKAGIFIDGYDKNTVHNLKLRTKE